MALPPLTLCRLCRRQRLERRLCSRCRSNVWQQRHGSSHERLEQGGVTGVAGSQGDKDAQQVLHLCRSAVARRQVLALHDRRLQPPVCILGLQGRGMRRTV